MKIKILAALFVALVCSFATRAQDFVQSYALVQAKPAGPGTGTSFANTGITSFAIFWTPATTVSTCAVQVDSSNDGVTWGTGDLIPSQNCAVAGSVPAATLLPGAIYIRVNVTALTGNGGVNVTLKGWGGAGGVSGAVGPGTPQNLGCFITTTNLQNCPDPITDTPGVGVNIPANVTIGSGTGAASVGYPSGDPATCLTPAAGGNFFCANGTANTEDLSLNGDAYGAIARINDTFPVYNIKKYGAICDFAHSAADTAAIQAAFAAALPTGGTIFFPHGGCVYDNSSSGYTFTSATNIALVGEGRGSIILFTTLANVGFFFNGASPNTCSGIIVKDLDLQYQPNRTTRGGSGYPINIEACQNVALSNLYLNNGNVAGIRIGNSSFVWALNNKISNFLANGYFTVDNIALHMVNTTCVNNNDACEEFSFFDGQAQAACHDISSTGMSSTNDSAGFIVNGCQHVTLSNFNITGAGGWGINVLQDNATTTTSFPDAVDIGNGTITNTGFGTNAFNTTAAPGIEINIAQTPGTNQRINLHDIHIIHTAQRCLFLGDHNTVDLTTNNIWCYDNGSTQVTGSGEAFLLAGGNVVKMTNTFSGNANRYALRVTLPTYFESTGFTSKNAQQGNTANVAIRNDSTGTWIMNGINLIDTFATTNRAGISNTAASGIQSINHVTATCTVNPCGVVTSTNTLTPPASQGLDFSAALNSDSVRFPNIAAAATTKNGSYAYDTTNKNVHVGANGVDNFDVMIPVSALPTNGDLASWSVVGGVVRIADAGTPPSGGGGCTSTCNYLLTLGDALMINPVSSTVMTGTNVPQLVRFHNALARTLGNGVVRINTLSAGGHADWGVYSISGTTGTLVWHTGSQSTASAIQIAVTVTPVTLAAGTDYFIGWCADNTTATIGALANGGNGGAMGNAGPAHTFGVDATDTCTAGVLPGTITTTNIANNATTSVPYIYATN